ncbi:hypothetical protein EAF04_005754 [Stromatinia cepivora]|nr:hypothetical protein EAF04_005754 [Stromatinia cepivora]
MSILKRKKAPSALTLEEDRVDSEEEPESPWKKLKMSESPVDSDEEPESPSKNLERSESPVDTELSPESPPESSPESSPEFPPQKPLKSALSSQQDSIMENGVEEDHSFESPSNKQVRFASPIEEVREFSEDVLEETLESSIHEGPFSQNYVPCPTTPEKAPALVSPRLNRSPLILYFKQQFSIPTPPPRESIPIPSPAPRPANAMLPPPLPAFPSLDPGLLGYGKGSDEDEDSIGLPAPPPSSTRPIVVQKTKIRINYNKTSKSIISASRDQDDGEGSDDSEGSDEEKDSPSRPRIRIIAPQYILPSLHDSIKAIPTTTMKTVSIDQYKSEGSDGEKNNMHSSSARKTNSSRTNQPVLPKPSVPKIVLTMGKKKIKATKKIGANSIESPHYDHTMAMYRGSELGPQIKDHSTCRFCVFPGGKMPSFRPENKLYHGIQERINRRDPMPWQTKRTVKDTLIVGPLTRQILHFRKDSDEIITTTIEFTDAPGEDRLHAFIDRAEEDARNAGMPENLEPIKLIVTWDNGAQLHTLPFGKGNRDNSTVHLIRTTKAWRAAIRQMRKQQWSNQNWTIWWREKHEDQDEKMGGISHDASSGKSAD